MECARFEVREDGIYRVNYLVVDNMEYGVTEYELILPKEIFIEAFVKYIGSVNERGEV